MAPAAVTTPNLLVDPGWLFWAPAGSTLPSNTVVGSVFTDSWPVAWLPLGATVDGSDLSYQINVAPMAVAELFDPVKYATTDRAGSLTFALADWTMTNLKRAMNGGTVTVTGTTTTTMSAYTLPTPGQEVRAMLGWESSKNDVRVVVLQAISSGTIDLAFKKAPNFSSIPCTWNMELPAGASQPFNSYTAGVTRG
jgi:hypothetical protein